AGDATVRPPPAAARTMLGCGYLQRGILSRPSANAQTSGAYLGNEACRGWLRGPHGQRCWPAANRRAANGQLQTGKYAVLRGRGEVDAGRSERQRGPASRVRWSLVAVRARGRYLGRDRRRTLAVA